MLDWIKFIAEFFLERLTSIGDLFELAFDGIGLFAASFVSAPGFLYPIITLMLSIAIIMWVVNIF